MSKDLASRFWAKVDKNGPKQSHMRTRCWVWLGTKVRGYGQVSVHGKMQYAHRVAFELTSGSTARLHVLHRCDNPACVNPRHLKQGTHQDNMRDRDRKGRQRTPTGEAHWTRSRPESILRGEQHGGHKLSRKQVQEIRQQGLAGCRGDGPRLAAKYVVSRSTISRILRGRSWNET